MTPTPDIWCGIPVYNNAGTILDVARRCRDQVAHVIVVDDGSTDADLRDLLAPLDVLVLRHPGNLGKGAALLTAMRHAAEHGGRYLLTLDGDGQHFPEDIARFLPRLAPATILVGRRDEVVGVMPSVSRFGRDFSDFWIYTETGASVADTQCGFRAYPLPETLELPLASRHYNFEVEVITRALWAGLDVQGVPIRVWYPGAGQRVSSFRPFLDNLRISLMHTLMVSRQLLPVPHRRVAVPQRSPSRRLDSAPIGLAVAAGTSVLLGILWWPYGAIIAVYVALRLHLNKLAVLAGLAVSALAVLSSLGLKVGRWLLQRQDRPRLEAIVGLHVMAVLMSVASAWLVYAVARRFAVDRA